MSISKIRLRNMVEENVKNADLILKLLENPDRLLSSILVGNNLVNNGASALTTALAIQMFHGTQLTMDCQIRPRSSLSFFS